MGPHLDATAQADLVRSGEVTSQELVEGAIERIEALNGELNAVIHPLFEEALATSAAAGPFQGVPFVVKDLMCAVKDTPHHEGMCFLRDQGFRADADSWLASRFRAAGFVFVGKTNTPELGILPTTEPDAYGASHNPWNVAHSPGGSSGGSASAVASGMVSIGHANDGGGSIRIPASCCGLVGLKATRARVSQAPMGDFVGGLATELVVSRSVRDTAAVLEFVSDGAPPGEPYFAPAKARPYTDEVGADPGKLRVGLMTSLPGGEEVAHPDCVAAAEAAVRELEALGHTVEVAHPGGLDDPAYIPQFLVRWTAGVAAGLDFWSMRTGKQVTKDDVEPLTWALAEAGRRHGAGEYLNAVALHQLVSRTIARWLEDEFDLLLTPSVGEPPPPLGSYDDSGPDPMAAIRRAWPTAAFSGIFNATGQPAISLPLYWTDDGLPVGVQLVAALGREDLLIRVAAQLERARPWADRTPPLFAEAESRRTRS